MTCLLHVLVAVTLVMLAAVGVGADIPEEEWNKTFGGTNADYAYSVQQTTDGGYIIAGGTGGSYGADWCDAWLVKTDSDGNEVWNRTFGGTSSDFACSVQQTSDSGYILTGYTFSYGDGSGDAWLVKTDSDGNEVWNRTLGGSAVDYAWSIQQTSDSGYILAGKTSGSLVIRVTQPDKSCIQRVPLEVKICALEQMFDV